MFKYIFVLLVIYSNVLLATSSTEVAKSFCIQNYQYLKNHYSKLLSSQKDVLQSYLEERNTIDEINLNIYNKKEFKDNEIKTIIGANKIKNDKSQDYYNEEVKFFYTYFNGAKKCWSDYTSDEKKIIMTINKEIIVNKRFENFKDCVGAIELTNNKIKEKMDLLLKNRSVDSLPMFLERQIANNKKNELKACESFIKDNSSEYNVKELFKPTKHSISF